MAFLKQTNKTQKQKLPFFLNFENNWYNPNPLLDENTDQKNLATHPRSDRKGAAKLELQGGCCSDWEPRVSFHLTCCHPVKSPPKAAEKTFEHVLSWIMYVFSKNSLSGHRYLDLHGLEA